MGYLSQKKHKLRESVFYTTVSLLMAAVSVCFLVNPEFVFIGFNLFHFYCLACVFFVGAVFAKKIVPSLLLGTSFLVIYTLIAISGNIFLSDKVQGSYSVKVEYNNQEWYPDNVISKGVLMIKQQPFANYAVVNEEAPVMLIKVDLSEFGRGSYKAILKHLYEFVIKQGVEVVIFGDFGMPAWAKDFRKFVEYSGLTVKNRFVFDGIFRVPHFYVLGFNNIGIKDLKVLSDRISADISYNIL